MCFLWGASFFSLRGVVFEREKGRVGIRVLRGEQNAFFLSFLFLFFLGGRGEGRTSGADFPTGFIVMGELQGVCLDWLFFFRFPFSTLLWVGVGGFGVGWGGGSFGWEGFFFLDGQGMMVGWVGWG